MRLLLVSLDSFSLFFPSTKYIFGGAELRSFHFATQLSAFENVSVTVITNDQGKKAEFVGKVKVVPHPFRKGEGFWQEQKKISTRILNRLTKKSTSTKDISALNDFFREQNPTHILSLGMSPETCDAWNYAKQAGIPFVFGCASDADLSESYLQKGEVKDISGNDASMYGELIRTANLVLVQTQHQAEILKARFGRDGLLLPNPIDNILAEGNEPALTDSDVLWIGKVSSMKRPELFVELAKRLPDYRFRMVLNNTNPERWNELVADKPANLEIIESVPVSQIEHYFKRTKLFVNTSIFEGSPNTFLQAGKYGIPLISMLADPNKMISEHSCGKLCGDDSAEMEKDIFYLLNNKAEYEKCAATIRSYVKTNHDMQTIITKLYETLSAL